MGSVLFAQASPAACLVAVGLTRAVLGKDHIGVEEALLFEPIGQVAPGLVRVRKGAPGKTVLIQQNRYNYLYIQFPNMSRISLKKCTRLKKPKDIYEVTAETQVSPPNPVIRV